MPRRRRLVLLQDLATDVRDAVRRRKGKAAPAPPPDGRSPDELGRRLDQTRERLRREIPPPEENP